MAIARLASRNVASTSASLASLAPLFQSRRRARQAPPSIDITTPGNLTRPDARHLGARDPGGAHAHDAALLSLPSPSSPSTTRLSARYSAKLTVAVTLLASGPRSTERPREAGRRFFCLGSGSWLALSSLSSSRPAPS
jgi:hypothetical protein